MKNNILKIAGATLMALALTCVSLAVPINGDIQFQGPVTVGSAGGTTTVTFGAPQTVIGTLGDYNGVTGVANFAPSLSFTGTGLGASLVPQVNSLWTIDGWSFDLTAIESGVFTDATLNSIAIIGSGWAHGPAGFDSTAAVWSLQGSSGSLVFQLSSNTTSAAGVPDGGSTAILIGAGLLGMSFLARRKLIG